LKARQRAEEARFILYCGFHAGLRRSEISMARVNWFDLEAGLFHASNDSGFTSKNREIRVIPLAQEFLHAPEQCTTLLDPDSPQMKAYDECEPGFRKA
jgi:integrase